MIERPGIYPTAEAESEKSDSPAHPRVPLATTMTNLGRNSVGRIALTVRLPLTIVARLEAQAMRRGVSADKLIGQFIEQRLMDGKSNR